MKVNSSIDNLIKSLEILRPNLTNNSALNKQQFVVTLNSALKNLNPGETGINTKPEYSELIPSWVNPKYAYDPENPRKPNFREVVEAISKKPYNELYYNRDQSEYERCSKIASDILYGVMGSNMDIRDWGKIMSAEDVTAAANKETGKMYNPVVDMVSNFDSSNKLLSQTAILKDDSGNTLSILEGNLSVIEENLNKYGASSQSITSEFDNKVEIEIFNPKVLAYLKNYSSKSEQIAADIQSKIIETSGKAIETKYRDNTDFLDPNIL